MRCFDANCFLGEPSPPVLRSFLTADDLLKEMDDLSIEQAMVCHLFARNHIRKGNQALMRRIKKQDRLQPCWILNPHHFSKYLQVKDILQELKDEGIRMVRLQPGPVEGYSLYEWALEELLTGLDREGIVLYIDLLTGSGLSHAPVPESEWPQIYQLARAYPDLKIILFGRKLSVSRMQVMGLLETCPNISLDISSFQVWRSTEILCEKFGPQRLVFGSYMPYFDAVQFMVQIAYARISEQAKEKITFSNLSDMIGL